jgi:hypothetical protein
LFKLRELATIGAGVAMMAASTSNLLHESNRAGVQFLMAEAQVGLTFLELALNAGIRENRLRILEKACEVYRTVVRLLPRVTLLPSENSELQRKMARLKEGLRAAGVPPET